MNKSFFCNKREYTSFRDTYGMRICFCHAKDVEKQPNL